MTDPKRPAMRKESRWSAQADLAEDALTRE
jgi:hypothetical protein